MDMLEKFTRKKVIILLLIIGAFVYGNSLFNGFVGDDTEQIYNLALVKGLSDLPKVFLYHHVVLGSETSMLGAYYKPLMLFYFYSVRMLLGIHPFVYHLLQIMFIISNAFFVYILFSKFFKKSVAVLLSIMFLIHPINQETAAYTSDIQDVLFFFFGILALLIVTNKKLHPNHYLLIGLLLLLSFLAKEAGVLFLVAIFLYTSFFRKQEIKKIFFLLLSVIILYCFFRLGSKTTSAFWIEPAPMSEISFIQRLKHIPLLFVYYVKTFLYPLDLSFNQQWVVKNFTVFNLLIPFIVSLSVIGSLVVFIFYTFKKHLAEKKNLLFFTLWFFIGLLPHMQLMALDATVATRWFYFSSVGTLGIIGVIITLLIKNYPRKKHLIFISFIVICSVLSVITIARNTKFQNAFVLYSNDHQISQSPLIENNLGDEYFKKGDLTTAEKYFKNALALNPNLWIAINNLGTVYEKRGNLPEASKYYQQAYRQGDRLPVVENIARVLLLSGKRKEAEDFITIQLKKYPMSSKLWLTLSLSYYEQEKYNEAFNAAKKSYELSPTHEAQSVLEAIRERVP